MVRLLEWLSYEMHTPSAYGTLNDSWFQYLTTVIWLGFMVYAYVNLRTLDPIKVKRLLFRTSMVLLVFEAYKQIIFTYQAAAYQWYAFPFQFCSVPMYLMIGQKFARGRLQTALWQFLQMYGLFAGFAVVLVPVAIYTSTIGINVQTMVHHGAIAYVGWILLLNHKGTRSMFMDATLVFVGVTVLASAMNTVFNATGNTQTFTMFFLNPRFNSNIPILSLFKDHISPLNYVLLFLLGYAMIAFFIYYLSALYHQKVKQS